MTRAANRTDPAQPKGHAGAMRFVHVNANASAKAWRAMNWPLAFLAIALATMSWVCVPAGQDLAIKTMRFALPVGPALALCCAMALGSAWRWARWDSALVLTQSALARHYRWLWVQALAGWQVPLAHVQTQLTLTPTFLGSDPLRGARHAQQEPGAGRLDARLKRASTSCSVARGEVLLSRAERLCGSIARAKRPALRADLQRRLQQLPLARAMAARGVDLHLPPDATPSAPSDTLSRRRLRSETWLQRRLPLRALAPVRRPMYRSVAAIFLYRMTAYCLYWVSSGAVLQEISWHSTCVWAKPLRRFLPMRNSSSS